MKQDQAEVAPVARPGETGHALADQSGTDWILNEVEAVKDVILSEPVEMEHMVVGDVHGDLSGLKLDLQAAGYIHEQGDWIAGRKVFVQMGDVIDRGPEGRAADVFLRNLQTQARQAGGDVVRILGNHELQFLQAILSIEDCDRLRNRMDWLINGGINLLLELGLVSETTYVDLLAGVTLMSDYHGAKETSIERDSLIKFKTLDDFFGDLKTDIANGNIVAAYSAGGRLFIHGGALPHITGEMTIDEVVEYLNKRLRDAVERKDFADKIFNIGYSRGGKGDAGIFWADYYRDIRSGKDIVKQIIGHTPEVRKGSEVRKTINDKCINVDVGHAEYYGGNRGYLVMKNNVANAYSLKKVKVPVDTDAITLELPSNLSDPTNENLVVLDM